MDDILPIEMLPDQLIKEYGSLTCPESLAVLRELHGLAPDDDRVDEHGFFREWDTCVIFERYGYELRLHMAQVDSDAYAIAYDWKTPFGFDLAQFAQARPSIFDVNVSLYGREHAVVAATSAFHDYLCEFSKARRNRIGDKDRRRLDIVTDCMYDAIFQPEEMARLLVPFDTGEPVFRTSTTLWKG